MIYVDTEELRERVRVAQSFMGAYMRCQDAVQRDREIMAVHSDPQGLARLLKRLDDEGKYTRQEQSDSA